MKQLLLLLCLLPGLSQAQKVLTLAECVDLLSKNNLTYRAGNLQAEAAQAQLRQTKSQIFPQINIGANHSLNLGRSIDQYTNAYIDELYNYNSIGAGFQMPIFQGFKIQNQIRQNQLLKESAMENRTAVLNAQTILLLQGYVNVLATKSLYESYVQQVESSLQQVDRVEKQLNAGVAAQSTLFEIKAQLANDKFDMVTALNNYKTARLALFQRMNIEPDDSIDFAALDPIDMPADSKNAEAVYQDALKQFPEIKAAELSRKSFTYLVKSIKADNYPSLTLGANIGAFYASTNRNLDYFNQLNATRNGSLSLGLNIPIMGRWVTRPRIELAKVQERQSQNQFDIAKQLLRQSVELAVLDVNSTADRFAAAQGQSESLTASFSVVESKLNAGTANIFEYALAKANLGKAQANAIQARYEYMMKQRLLQFYRQGTWIGIY
ncbi:outer membrane protein [Dyadobacter koreensis]|uniref:Outer membrane protein n=1 Tax=Dyadobacter koreensis TaxID=408657 RepID=A0A1H6TW72_9BACT|nr:TolC family protein [Dyadobacter koreensis]SEI81487.1 outer membrane protein [Dyadobacter koreensis]